MPLYSIAQIVVGLPVHGPFDYLVPVHLRDQIKVGHRVYVSFRSGTCVGYVVGLLTKSSFPRLKTLMSILDNVPLLDDTMLKLSRELSEYYACSWGEAIEIVLPKALRTKKAVVWNPQKVSLLEAPKAQIFYCEGSVKSSWRFLAEKIKETVLAGRGVVFLVPEVRQLESAKNFLEKNCGLEVAVLDRSLPAKRELEEWLAVKEGKIRVVAGTRSAVFAPVPRLGLIVMADEENSSYKQEPSPFYHAREASLLRQKYDGCDLIFVSPAPTAELWKILKEKKAVSAVVEPSKTASLHVIDLTNYKPQKSMMVSFPLQNHIQETLAKKGKVLLFLNRRGFSLITRCNQCGFVVKCEHCNTNMSFLYSRKKMVCHRCGSSHELPKLCPQCNGSYLRSMGTGIEKLESDLTRIYPQIRIALFDRDSKEIPLDADLIIATHAIMPVLGRIDFSLIAVLDFDGEINRVDFRASQRVFSLLVRLRQAASEKLFVQTANSGHEAIKAAAKMDLEQFYRGELKTRRELDLPPFMHLISLGLRGIKEESVFNESRALHERLTKISAKMFAVGDPQPDITPKLRDQFRFTIMLKGKSVRDVLEVIEPLILEFKKRKGVILTVDVDP